MKTLKTLILSQILVLFFFALTANAQVASPCVSLSRSLSYGSQGSDVYTLQNFLIGQGLMNASATGYFGPITQSAVMRFQSMHGIAATGVVGPITRGAMGQNCTGTSYYDSSYNNQYPYNTYNSSSYNSGYYGTNYQTGSVNISSLSPNYGSVGTQVTIYGSGFTQYGNNVLLNGTTIGSYSSTGGSIIFTVPSSSYSQTGSYQVSVSNTNGVSNSMPFTLGYNPNQYNCVYYNTCGNTNNYNSYNCSYYNNCNTSVTSNGGANAPVLRITSAPSNVTTSSQASWSIEVTDPMVGYVTTVVRWGDEGFNNSAGPNTQTAYASQPISFSIGHTYQTAGSYTVIFTATNNAGYQSTITSVINVTGSSTGTGSSSISYLSPSQGQVGTQIMIQGSGFNSTNNMVHFGIGGSLGLSSSNGTTIYYTIPHYVSSCDLASSSCQSTPTQVTPGTYPIYVSNASGQTSTLNFLVTQ